MDPEDGESLEALWSDILEDDHLSGKDTAIIELRARVAPLTSFATRWLCQLMLCWGRLQKSFGLL